MTAAKPEETATCRGCGRQLIGLPYYRGGSAYVPNPDGSHGERAKVNFYGGFVCSRQCDYASSMRLENTMPGAGISTRLSTYAQERLNANWPD